MSLVRLGTNRTTNDPQEELMSTPHPEAPAEGADPDDPTTAPDGPDAPTSDDEALAQDDEPTQDEQLTTRPI